MKALRRWSAIMPVLLLLMGPSRGAAEERLIGVRTGPWEDRCRVVLDLTAEVAYHAWVLTDPDRIAIDLPGVAADDLPLPKVEDWMVAGIRLIRLGSGTSQVVLDLTQAPRYKVFTVPPGDGRGFRIVCDVYRTLEPPPPEPDATAPWIVVIDPGHGGRDPGAMHNHLNEKDVVLDVSRRLAERLNHEAGVRAYLTRDRDIRVGLQNRVRKAEAAAADVFVSIHVNGCKAQSARGAEVFYLSLQGADDVETRELAALENEAKEEADDPLIGEIAELPFAVDLIQTDTLRRSSVLAEAILDALSEEGLAASRGVKQANFVVLRSCRVPSALVELGFISNPADAQKLGSSDHRQTLAERIALGLLQFRLRYARQAHSAG